MTRFPSIWAPIGRSVRGPSKLVRPPVAVVVVARPAFARGLFVAGRPSLESVGVSVAPTELGTEPTTLTVAGGGGDAASLAEHPATANALSARKVARRRIETLNRRRRRTRTSP